MKLIAKIYCLIFGHNYSVSRIISKNIREIKCLCCHKEWGMNDYNECMLPLDDELRQLHDFLKDEL